MVRAIAENYLAIDQREAPVVRTPVDQQEPQVGHPKGLAGESAGNHHKPKTAKNWDRLRSSAAAAPKITRYPTSEHSC